MFQPTVSAPVPRSLASPPVPLAHPGMQMTNEEFMQFRDFIYQHCGIFYQDNKKYLLEGRIAKRMQHLKMTAFSDYLTLIRFGAQRQQEYRFLYEAITINETFFFRNEAQLAVMDETLVPQFVKSKQGPGRSKLRIWSAASSSGEEAHTIAIMYLEKWKNRYPSLDIEIIGTDISPHVLETAKKGVYRQYSVRNMPPEIMKKYFLVNNGEYTLKDEVRQLVRFDQLNLYDDARMRQMTNFDVIFCANVLIYFDLNSKIKVVSHLYNSLVRDGTLFIGYAESLHGISKAFKVIHFPKTIAYKKE
ncbi:MAG: CheR family methyltransferase [Acidobacteriota bacterium]